MKPTIASQLKQPAWMRADGEESLKATEDDSTVHGDRYEDDSQSKYTENQILPPHERSIEIESLEK